jgi:hypothetical protein
MDCEMDWLSGLPSRAKPENVNTSLPLKVPAEVAAWRLREMHYSTMSLMHGFSHLDGNGKGKVPQPNTNETIDYWMQTTLNVTQASRDFRLPISPEYAAAGRSGFDYIRDHLGYRLELRSAVLPRKLNFAAAGENATFSFEVALINWGFAAPVSPRPVQLVVLGSNDTVLWRSASLADPRDWQPFVPGDPTFLPLLHRLSADVSIPSSALRCSAGQVCTFSFGLAMPDMRMGKVVAEGSAGGAAYCIRLANDAVPWLQGVNVLAEFSVSYGVGDDDATPPPSGSGGRLKMDDSSGGGLRFAPPIALTDNSSWYKSPAIDGYTSLGDGVLVSPRPRGFNFSMSDDNGKSWAPVSLHSAASNDESQNFTTIVQGGFVRATQSNRSGGILGHTLGTLPVWCNTCVTRSPGYCDPRASAMCPGLVCNQTHSPLYFNVTTSGSAGQLRLDPVCRQVGVRGLPRPLRKEFGLASGFAGPSGPAVLADGSLIITLPIKFADSPTHKAPSQRRRSIDSNPPGPPPKHKLKTVSPMSLVALRSSDGGFMWDYAGSVASSEQLPWSWYGPNEHDVATLSDGKTLVVIFRPDSDGFCPGTPAYRFFYQSYSFTGGVSWTAPRPVPGVGCVRPRLLRLANGPLLLTGGRLCPTLVGKGTQFPQSKCFPQSGGGKGGNYVWVNVDGMADAAGSHNGSEWQVQCVTEHHNAGWSGEPTWLFTNNTSTQAYNSLQPLGESSAAVFYEHGWGPSKPSQQFMMRIDVGDRERPTIERPID